MEKLIAELQQRFNWMESDDNEMRLKAVGNMEDCAQSLPKFRAGATRGVGSAAIHAGT